MKLNLLQREYKVFIMDRIVAETDKLRRQNMQVISIATNEESVFIHIDKKPA
jgi:hypothetical protein